MGPKMQSTYPEPVVIRGCYTHIANWSASAVVPPTGWKRHSAYLIASPRLFRRTIPTPLIPDPTRLAGRIISV